MAVSDHPWSPTRRQSALRGPVRPVRLTGHGRNPGTHGHRASAPTGEVWAPSASQLWCPPLPHSPVSFRRSTRHLCVTFDMTPTDSTKTEVTIRFPAKPRAEYAIRGALNYPDLKELWTSTEGMPCTFDMLMTHGRDKFNAKFALARESSDPRHKSVARKLKQMLGGTIRNTILADLKKAYKADPRS